MSQNSPFFDGTFIINTGKGGVGKTTLSAAMAVSYARQGKRVLLMELNTRDRMGELFGTDPVGPDIVPVAPNIDAVDTTPVDALREYALMGVKVKALYRSVFENPLIDRFLRVIPGMPELTMLGKAYFHESEVDERTGRKRYDVVIIDAPATGHGLFLLQIPEVISSTLSVGPMAAEARQMQALLCDPSRTRVNLITLAEEMPVRETFELYEKLSKDTNISLGAVFLNAMMRETMEPRHERICQDLSRFAGSNSPVGRLLARADFRTKRREMQARYAQELKDGLPLPLVTIPFYFDEVMDQRVLERMAVHMEEQLGRAS